MLFLFLFSHRSLVPGGFWGIAVPRRSHTRFICRFMNSPLIHRLPKSMIHSTVAFPEILLQGSDYSALRAGADLDPVLKLPSLLRVGSCHYLGLSQGPASPGMRECPSTQKLLESTPAAHGRTWPSDKAPPATESTCLSHSVIQVPRDALHVSGEAKSRMVKHRGCGTRRIWVQILAPLLISYVTLGQLLTLSVPQFPDMVVMSPYLTELFRGLRGMMYSECLA